MERVPALLLLADGSRRRVELFLQPGEELGALLERPEPFLPVVEDEEIRLVARRQLACVGVLGGAPAPEPELPHHRREVIVRLASGVVLHGFLRFPGRPGRNRVADFLNEEGRAFVLYEDGREQHVAKRHVESVQEV